MPEQDGQSRKKLGAGSGAVTGGKGIFLSAGLSAAALTALGLHIARLNQPQFTFDSSTFPGATVTPITGEQLPLPPHSAVSLFSITPTPSAEPVTPSPSSTPDPRPDGTKAPGSPTPKLVNSPDESAPPETETPPSPTPSETATPAPSENTIQVNVPVTPTPTPRVWYSVPASPTPTPAPTETVVADPEDGPVTETLVEASPTVVPTVWVTPTITSAYSQAEYSAGTAPGGIG